MVNENCCEFNTAKLSHYIKEINTTNSKSKPYKNIIATLTEICIDVSMSEIKTSVIPV